MTQRCPTCHNELDDGVRFCPHDGTPLTETAQAVGAHTPAGSHKRPKTQELQLPVVVGSRYRLTELRGGGGMAKVYRATDVTLEREVAVKLINPDLRSEPEFEKGHPAGALNVPISHRGPAGLVPNPDCRLGSQGHSRRR